MKKYKFFIAIIFIVTYLFLLYLKYDSLNTYREASLHDLEMQTIDMDKLLIVPIDRFHASSFSEWGIKRSWLLEQREKKHRLLEEKKNKGSIDNKKLTQKYDLTNRVICLNKICWEFMGIFQIRNKLRVTLLSQGKEHKLKTFEVGDNLLEGLKITEIRGEEILLFNQKKEETFSLKLFDINVSKYAPKKFQNKKEINE